MQRVYLDKPFDPVPRVAQHTVKELAAKLNQQLFRQAISDEEVGDLVRRIQQDGGKSADAYLAVYQLGFGNNARAVPELVKLSTHANEYVPSGRHLVAGHPQGRADKDATWTQEIIALYL